MKVVVLVLLVLAVTSCSGGSGGGGGTIPRPDITGGGEELECGRDLPSYYTCDEENWIVYITNGDRITCSGPDPAVFTYPTDKTEPAPIWRDKCKPYLCCYSKGLTGPPHGDHCPFDGYANGGIPASSCSEHADCWDVVGDRGGCWTGD